MEEVLIMMLIDSGRAGTSIYDSYCIDLLHLWDALVLAIALLHCNNNHIT